MGKTFTVRLVRPVFETVVVEVEAWSHKDARRKALDSADKLPVEDWAAVTFDEREYSPHVASIIDNQEIYETSLNPHAKIRASRLADQVPETIKYMILAADLESGEGHCLPQPWFEYAETSLQADLCSGWIDPLNFIVENDGLGEVEVQPRSERQSNVIDFPVSYINDEVGQVSA